jgi:hypothetical protein
VVTLPFGNCAVACGVPLNADARLGVPVPLFSTRGEFEDSRVLIAYDQTLRHTRVLVCGNRPAHHEEPAMSSTSHFAKMRHAAASAVALAIFVLSGCGGDAGDAEPPDVEKN